jgi:hypothetical protein
MATTIASATSEIEAALFKLRLIHNMQTDQLITQAKALFTLEAALLEQEKDKDDSDWHRSR